jgi:asparagine synthase (glutamine-hydrolysing)
LVIFASPETPVISLEGGNGLVLGRLIRKTGGALRSLGSADGRAAIDSEGASLVRDFWGNYVALIGAGERAIIVRDPAAVIPAYVHDAGDVRLCCSHFELAEGICENRSIDDEFLRQWLCFPFLRTSRTGLANWDEVLPGTCLSGENSKLLWTPWHRLAPAGPLPAIAEAASRVRQTTLSSVAQLLAGTSRPVVELSGGLDSAIVAASLHHAGIEFEAVNFVTRMPDGDERHYARILARHFGVKLTELTEDDRPLELGPPSPAPFRPSLSPVLQQLERARLGFAAANQGISFVTGAGGDNLFCYLGTATPIIDSIAAKGLAGGFATALEVAELGECTIFKALGYAVRKALRRDRWRRWDFDRRFLSAEAVTRRSDPHPWLSVPAGASPGSIEHVKSLVRAQHFLQTEYEFGHPVLHPLLSQPLMDVCLSIPSWLWVQAGRNRSVARAAFSDLIPSEVIERRTKGRLESMCARAFCNNRHELAELLLEGELARRGLLDRSAVERYLRSGGEPRDDDYFRIFDLASLELWLGCWTD